jgi:fused signal recognition particle receptor
MAGFFSKLKEGLSKTRNNIVHGIDSVFSGFSSIDEEFYEELEEILIMGDIGVNATSDILERLRRQVKENHIKEPSLCKSFLIESIKEQNPTLSETMQGDERIVIYREM